MGCDHSIPIWAEGRLFPKGFKLTCNKGLTPPKLFINIPYANLSRLHSYEVVSISYNSSEVIIETPIGEIAILRMIL